MDAVEEISVLVVDDSDFFGEITSEKLRDGHGFTTKVSNSGPEALKSLREQRVDCVVSDYEMPGMNGLELYEKISAEFSIPFILMTGQGGESVASDAIGTGVDDHLQKKKIIDGKRLELLATRIRNVVGQHRAQKKYERLVDNTPDEIVEVTTDGRILAANKSMARAHETTRPELIDSQLSDVLPAEIASERLEYGQRAITAGSAVTFQDSIGVRHFHNIVTPLSETGDTDTVQFISREITQQKHDEQALKQTKRELEQSNEKLDKFASVVSHDLRNPLMVTKARVDFIRDDAPTEHVETMERNLGRMETMIDELLTLARMEESMTDLSEVALATVAKDAWEHTQTDGGTLELALSDDSVVEADHNRLLQIFENLFRNAFDHNSTPPTLRVGTLDDGAETELSGFYVEDDGRGIPPENRSAVFDHGHTTSDDGSGFGLSIVTDIVAAHDWKIAISESHDGGVRFEIRV
ncbi:response regulator [Haloarcula sp. CBA1130]|uniref:ATP-binding response regulator n=1 Tax=unclassified Haloarcula TaxID=2624677 RepID=UPI001245BB3B|nr:MULTISPECIES: response regulator [unclassified Haloarcula]KAA9398394.1 response regulator [Haloarcula sp. CBA1129]KAA9402011.1 response regulator [Haloarcula sp. CBA1130]